MSELEDLVAFALLVEAGSFTAAAERLGCSKGQLSKRISGLERSLGSQLLHRTTRRLHLTAAGAALLPEAQALQAQAQRARQTVRSLQDEVAGTVRLTVPVSLGETFFDALLLDFASRYPQVRVELDLANAYRDLLADGFDLAIRSGVEQDERLVARPLFALQAQGQTRRVAAGLSSFIAPSRLVRGSQLLLTCLRSVAEEAVARDASLVLHPLPAGLELPQVEVMQIWHERTDADRLRRWLRQQIQQVAGELRR